MQATAAIKIEVSSNSINNKAIATPDEASESFSNALDKQISIETSKETASKNVNKQTTGADTKVPEEEISASEDGKNLPTEAAHSHHQAEQKADQHDATEEGEGKAQSVSQDDSESEKVIVNTSDVALVGQQPTAENAMPTEKGKASSASQSNDKVVVKKEVLSGEADVEIDSVNTKAGEKVVIADEQAAEHAQTQTVNIVSRQQTAELNPKQKQSSQADVNKSDKAESETAETKTMTSEIAVTQTDVTVKKVASGSQNQATPMSTQNTAQTNPQNIISKSDGNTTAELKTASEEVVMTDRNVIQSGGRQQNPETEQKAAEKPTAIRADILEALNKQVSKTDADQISLKNKITAQYQEARSAEYSPIKTALSAMLDGKQEKTPTLFVQPVTTSASAAASLTSTTATGSTSVPTLDVQPAVQSAGWSKVMVGRVVWMAKEGVQQAELKLTPADMGPIEVRLQVKNEQVSVSFQAQHATTREALEQALPRLRESFADNGIQLANADVGGQSQQQQQHNEGEHSSSQIIFSQVNNNEDDIDSEQEKQKDSALGLSLYA